MKFYNKCFAFMLSAFFSIAVFAKDIALVNELKDDDRSTWVIEKRDGTYSVKYTNEKGKVYSNSTIVTSDIEGSHLFLDKISGNAVSLLMDYPKDSYFFKFSSGYIPNLLSACKRIILPSADLQQAAALLTLCTKESVMNNITLSNADAGKLLASDNLVLVGTIKTFIGNDKAFLYDENKIQKKRKPYLIKGDAVEIVGYKNSMLKIKYITKSKFAIAWIKFVDIL